MNEPSDQQTPAPEPQKRKKSLHDKLRGRAGRITPANQLEAYMTYGVFPLERTLQYPTPPDALREEGDVERGGARYLINGITYLRRYFPGDEITVQLSTPGGCDYAMFAVYDAISDPRFKNPIIIEV